MNPKLKRAFSVINFVMWLLVIPAFFAGRQGWFEPKPENKIDPVKQVHIDSPKTTTYVSGEPYNLPYTDQYHFIRCSDMVANHADSQLVAFKQFVATHRSKYYRLVEKHTVKIKVYYDSSKYYYDRLNPAFGEYPIIKSVGYPSH